MAYSIELTLEPHLVIPTRSYYLTPLFNVVCCYSILSARIERLSLSINRGAAQTWPSLPVSSLTER